MRFGIQVRATAATGDLRGIGRALEASGFESLFLPEHTHIPLAVQSLFPDDPDWLDACKRMLDPFVALAGVAAATTQLRLGTGVALIPQHHPLTLAKTVATLDLLSNGRVILGAGAGWNLPELRNHGVEPSRRWRVLREHILAMKAVWTSDVAEFHGESVDFGPLWLWPKPVQQPHPPVALGGEGPHVLERVLDYGDAWMPNDHPGIEARMAELQERAAALGRPRIPVTIYGAPRSATDIERFIDAGADRIVFNLPPGPGGEELAAISDLAVLIRPYR